MIDPEQVAVVCIDAQERLFPVMTEPDRLAEAFLRLFRGARLLKLPILVTEHVPEKLGPTLPSLSALLPADAAPVKKSRFSAYDEPAFQARLKALNRPTLLLCGMEAHVCVYQTALDLLAAGYEVQMVLDAMASRLERNCQLALRRIEAAGGAATSVEMALFEGVRGAESDRVRQMLRLLK